jgi:hypothetical protein
VPLPILWRFPCHVHFLNLARSRISKIMKWYKIWQCTGALPAFIISSEQVIVQGRLR